VSKVGSESSDCRLNQEGSTHTLEIESKCNVVRPWWPDFEGGNDTPTTGGEAHMLGQMTDLTVEGETTHTLQMERG
jgi:hypothetical protein